MSKVFVINKSPEPIECFMSKYTEGNDSWFRLNPEGGGARDPWTRGSGWELVAFRRPGSGNSRARAGIYLNVESGKTVEFYNFGNIVAY
jgi:hypothetical protein